MANSAECGPAAQADETFTGVSPRSGAPGTPRSTGFWKRLFYGFAPPGLSGIAEIGKHDTDPGGPPKAVWSGYLHEPPTELTEDGVLRERVGVACSGGGIRSASFCLGGLQALREPADGHMGRALLQDAEYLAAVSGGAYISVAYAALVGLTRRREVLAAEAEAEAEAEAAAGDAKLSTEQRDDARAAGKKVADALLATPPPWALSAPETVNLRNHTRYLAPNLQGQVTGLATVIFGLIRHVLPFAALAIAIGVVYGWVLIVVLHMRGAAEQGRSPDIDLGAVAIAAIAGGACVGFASIPLFVRQAQEGTAASSTGGQEILVGLGAGLALGVGAGILARMSGGTGLIVVGLAFGAFVVSFVWMVLARPWLQRKALLHVVLETWTARLVLLGVAVGLLLCAIPLLLRLVRYESTTLWSALGANLGVAAMVRRLAGYAKSVAGSKWRRLLVAVASYVLGPLVLAVAVLLVAYLTIIKGFEWGDLSGPSGWLLLAGSFLIVTWLLDDESRSPLHILYKERLSTAFIRYRTCSDGRVVSAEPPWDEGIGFSSMDLDGHPKLVVCAAVNLAGDVVPPGRFAASFTFEKHRSGGPLTGYVRTEDLEAAAGPGVLTFPAMMAVSGAAISPLMGRLTRPGWRVLMAIFQARLGMWLPNPRRLPGVKTARHDSLPVTPDKRLVSTDPTNDPPSVTVHPPSVWWRPGWPYALIEAFGGNTLRRRYLSITDGGHWENLGLVELLRRGCTRIVCLDASDDHTAPFTALGQAIALAKDELQVEVTVPTAEMYPGSGVALDVARDAKDKRLATTMCAVGRFTYPNGRRGTVAFVKNVLPVDAPPDVRAYADTHKPFPFDTTVDQFFDDEKFDAYRALGYHGGRRALSALQAHDEASAAVSAIEQLIAGLV